MLERYTTRRRGDERAAIDAHLRGCARRALAEDPTSIRATQVPWWSR
jgi:hypothetical protein